MSVPVQGATDSSPILPLGEEEQLPLADIQSISSWAGWGWELLCSGASYAAPAVKTAAIWTGSAVYQGTMAAGSLTVRAAAVGVSWGASKVKMAGARKFIQKMMPTFESHLKWRTIDSELDEVSKKRLKVLDRKGALAALSERLATSICAMDAVKDLLPAEYASFKGYLTFVIHRGIAKLACLGPIEQDGQGLLTNLVKNLYTLISGEMDSSLIEALDDYVWLQAQVKAASSDSPISQRHTDLLRRLAECDRRLDRVKNEDEKASLLQAKAAILNEMERYQQLSDKYWEVLHQGDISELQFLQNHYATERAELTQKLRPITEQLFKALGFDAGSSYLEWALLKGVTWTRKQFDGIEGLAAGYFLDFYVEMCPPSQLSVEQRMQFSHSEETNASEDVHALLNYALPVVLEKLAGNDSALASSLTALEGDSNWVQQLAAAASSQDPVLNQLYSTISHYLAPRLVDILMKISSNGVEGKGQGIIEKALLSGIAVFRRHLIGKSETLTEAIRDYDQYGLKADAYDACRSFLQANKELEKQLSNSNRIDRRFLQESALVRALSLEEVKRIVSSLEEKKRKAFQALYPNPEGDVDYVQIQQFFALEGFDARQQQKTALEPFVALATDLFQSSGLDSDTAIGFGKTSVFPLLDLDQLRNQTVPALLLETYRTFTTTEKGLEPKAVEHLLDAFSAELAAKQESKNIPQLTALLSLLDTNVASSSLVHTLSHIGHSWFNALNSTLEEFPIVRWSSEERERLNILDPKQKLSEISHTITNKALEGSKKAIAKSLNNSLELIRQLEILAEAVQIRDQYFQEKSLRVTGAKASEHKEYILAIFNEQFPDVDLEKALFIVNQAQGVEGVKFKSLADFFHLGKSEVIAAQLHELSSTPLMKQGYDVAEASDEIQEFAQNYLSQVVERLIGKLALSHPDQTSNALLSNALKAVLSLIEKKDVAHLQKLLSNYQAATQGVRKLQGKKGYGKALKAQARAHAELIKAFSPIVTKVLASAELTQPSDLHLLALPYGNAKIEAKVWKELNEQLPKMLSDAFAGLQFESLLTAQQKAELFRMKGYQQVQQDSAVVASQLVPTLFAWMGRPENRFFLGHVFKDLLDGMKVEGLSRAWVEELLERLADVHAYPRQKDETIRMLWSFLETLLGPRLFSALENMAVHLPGREGNFLQRVIAQSVHLTHEILEGKHDALKQTIIKYEEFGLLADAYDWRNRYLKEVKGRKATECEQYIPEIDVEEVEGILEMGSFKGKKLHALVAAIRKHVLLQEEQDLSDINVLLKYFSTLDRVGEKESRAELLANHQKLENDYKDWLAIESLYNYRQRFLVKLGLASLKEEANLEQQQVVDPDYLRGLEAIRRQMPTLEHAEEGTDEDLIKEFFAADRLEDITAMKKSAYEADVSSMLLYDLRDQYLIGKGIPSSECKKEAVNLTEEDVQRICEDNGFDEEDIAVLEKSVVPYFADVPSDGSSPLLRYLRLPGSITMREKQVRVLREGFGDAGDRVLEHVGLVTDKGFSLPGATGADDAYYSLEYVRNVAIPQTILTLYRDMSDFKGMHAANKEKLEQIFGEEKAVADDVLAMFSHQIAEATRTYLKTHGKMVAELAKEYFPNSERILEEAIQGIFTADPKKSPVSAQAADEMTGFIEELVTKNAVHVLVSLGLLPAIDQKAVEDAAKPKEEANAGGFTGVAKSVVKSVSHQAARLGKAYARYRGGDVGAPEAEEKEVAEAVVQEKKPQLVSSSEIFGNVLRHLGAAFRDHRSELQSAVDEYRSMLSKLELAKEKYPNRYTAEYIASEKATFLRLAFRPITQDLIKLSGLTAKNLYCPSGLEDQVWKAITENVLPDMLAQFYLDMTEVEQTKALDQDRLVKTGLTHGPAVAKGLAHYGIDLTQSMIALGGEGLAKSITPTVLKILHDSNTESGARAAAKIEGNAEQLESVLGGNLEEVARVPETKDVFDALREAIVEPIILKGLATLGENLQKIQEKNAAILMKIAAQVFSSLADHFERVRNAAFLFGAEHAYDLPHSKVLEVETSDPIVLNYISLLEARAEAEAEVASIESSLFRWSLFNTANQRDALNSAEEEFAGIERAIKDQSADEEALQRKQVLEEEISRLQEALYVGNWNPLLDKEALKAQLKEAKEKLRIARKDIRDHLEVYWNEGAEDSLNAYIKAERDYREAEANFAEAKNGWFQWAINGLSQEIWDEEYTVASVNQAGFERAIAQTLLTQAEKELSSVRQTALEEKSSDTSDIKSRSEYKQLLAKKEQAQQNLNKVKLSQQLAKAQKALEVAEKAYDNYCDAYNLIRLKNGEPVDFSLKSEHERLEGQRRIAYVSAAAVGPKEQKELEAAEEAVRNFEDAYCSKLLEKLELQDLSKADRYKTLTESLELAEEKFKKEPTSQQAKDALEKARKEWNDYRLNYYFNPYAAKLLKFVEIDQLRQLKFSDKVPVSISDAIVDQAVAKLPEVLNNVYIHLTKEETLLGFMNSLLINLEASEAAVGRELVKKVEEVKEHPTTSGEDANTVQIRQASGKMVLEAMKVMPTGFKTLLFNIIPGLEGSTQETFEQAVGALVVDYIHSQSLVGLSDSTLKSMTGGLASTGRFSESGEFIAGENPFPLTKEEVEARKAKQPTLDVLRAEVQGRFAERGKKLVKLNLDAYYKKTADSIKGFFETLVRSICPPAYLNDVVDGLNRFLNQVFHVIGRIADIPAIAFWAVIGWLSAQESEEAVKTFSKVNPERAFMQVTNILMNSFGKELSWIVKNNKEEALQAAEKSKRQEAARKVEEARKAEEAKQLEAARVAKLQEEEAARKAEEAAQAAILHEQEAARVQEKETPINEAPTHSPRSPSNLQIGEEDGDLSS